MYLKFLKPMLDILIASLALIALSPVLLLTACAVLIEDGRPVFFIHKRIGRNGRKFSIFKFRSMEKDADIVESVAATKLRITGVGSLIRRLNIDELPQLLNVIMQDMSLVGPRPGLAKQVDLHNARRMNGSIGLLPGITGLAQVNSYDGMTTEEKAALDGEYAKTVSLYTDLRVILLTFRYLLKRPPTY